MGFFSDLIGSITGSGQRDAARESTAQQVAAGQQAIGTIGDAASRAQGFFDPFAGLGQQGVDLAGGFIGDAQGQFDFLQSNPLFQLALENANQQTLSAGAAGGRLASGDTLQQLSNNTLLSAQPLIDRQRQDIFGLLGIGTGIAGQQAGIEQNLGANIANLQTGIGATQAAGTIAAQNAIQSGLAGQLGGGIGGAISGSLTGLANQGLTSIFSDPRLKENIKEIGAKNGYTLWSWNWNKVARDKFGLTGLSTGVMFPEVLAKNPEATSYRDGFGMVNYQMIGV